MTERPDQQTDSTLDGAELPRGGDEQGAAVGDGGGIAERDLAEQRDKYLRLAAE